MMGGANIPARAPPMAGQVPLAVISPQFCAGYPVYLTITRKLMTSANGTFGVTDFHGNIMFTVKSKVFSLHDRRVLLDSAGNPIITFQQKMISAHRRWKAFRGESTDAKDLLFNVKKSSMFRSKRKLDVFLAANAAEEICDFKIDGNWSEGSCVICAGNTNNIIAQVNRKHEGTNGNLFQPVKDDQTYSIPFEAPKLSPFIFLSE